MVAIRLITPEAGADAAECPTGHDVVAPASILLVEDDLPTSDLIFAAFAPTQRVTRAASVAEARAWLATRFFDVAFVSLALPGNAGVRLLMELKRVGEMPVVALVGGANFFHVNYQLRMATTTGADGALQKPIGVERARVVLDQVLSGPRVAAQPGCRLSGTDGLAPILPITARA